MRLSAYFGKASFTFSFITLIFFASFAVGADVSYTFKISENGDTNAFIFISGNNVVDIPLPKDATGIQIDGGIYVDIPEGIEVSVGNSGRAVVAFKTSSYTGKVSDIWYFDAKLHMNSTAELQLPDDVQVVKTNPHATITRDNSLKIRWDDADVVNASYVFIGSAVSNVTPAEDDSRMLVTILLAVGITLILISLVFFSARRMRKKHGAKNTENVSREDPKINESQMNIIRAANPNEALVIRTVLKNNGHIRRNALEKESGLSKSSLASSLNNLEKKNIILIDRSFRVHYITFTDWFRNLK